MGTFKLQMKEGIEGQIGAQRQDDFVDKPDYSGKFPSQVPNYKGHNKSISTTKSCPESWESGMARVQRTI